MTLTVDQRKTQAVLYRDIADVLDPLVTTPGGTVVTPDGFTGRWTPDLAVWDKVPLFEDNFPNLAAEKEFLQKYSRWGCETYATTSKKGVYTPDNLSVIQTEYGTAMNSRLVPGSKYADGKVRGTNAFPRLPGQNDGAFSDIFVEQRMWIPKKVGRFHIANMGWPTVNATWPTPGGETDYVEMNTDADGVGCFFHVVGGGSTGQGQIHFYKKLDITKPFVVGFEFLAGKSFKWFVNGEQITADDGKTKTVSGNLVPTQRQKILLQNEDDGSDPTEEANICYDWFTAWKKIV